MCWSIKMFNEQLKALWASQPGESASVAQTCERRPSPVWVCWELSLRAESDASSNSAVIDSTSNWRTIADTEGAGYQSYQIRHFMMKLKTETVYLKNKNLWLVKIIKDKWKRRRGYASVWQWINEGEQNSRSYLSPEYKWRGRGGVRATAKQKQGRKTKSTVGIYL